MATVVVFGGNGFVGTYLLRRLVADKTQNVVSVDVRSPSVTIPGVDYRTHDVRDLSGFKIGDTIKQVYNLAAVHTTPGHPFHEYYETNVFGASEITKFAGENGVLDLVFTSSISVYGPSEETKTEATSPAPESAYGWSKLMAERIHRHWMEENVDRKLTIVRPAVVFGHGEGGNFVRLARLMRKGVFVYPGRKDTIKACIYVKDLVRYMVEVSSRNERFTLFNACYPDRYRLEQIIEALKNTAFPKARTFTVPRVLLSAAASAIAPFAKISGIHPDRITKLVRSTDIYPQWLTENGLADSSRLSWALEDWKADSHGKFD